MKLLVLALMLAATGCGATGSDPGRSPPAVAAPLPAQVAGTAPADPASPPRASQTVVQATAGTTALAVGQVLEIVLEGSAGTGYAWQLEADGSPQLRPLPMPPSPDAADDGPRRVGGPTVQRWHFVAERAGEATVKLSYRRPWESGAPARDAVFGVVVNEAAP